MQHPLGQKRLLIRYRVRSLPRNHAYRSYALFPCASWIARHSTSGVAAIATCLMPSTESASTSALATAGMAPTQPASPAPLTPSGLVLVGTGLLSTWKPVRSDARGMA